MITSTAVFAASSIPVVSNGVKSLLFRIAESLLVFAVYKIFSLIASAGHLFTAYLMLGEDYAQRALFVGSRNKALSGNVLVAVFSVAGLLAQLYGTLLWFLDSPGYVVQSRNVTASGWTGELLADPAYIVQMSAGSPNLTALENSLPRIIGQNLFKPTLNVTLTEEVRRGLPQIVEATPGRRGGRIWLDDEGLSVSPDTAAMSSYTTDATGQLLDVNCIPLVLAAGMRWNCTFDNVYSLGLLNPILGRPEVHWDNESDGNSTGSRYVNVNRMDNIWAAYGQGGGTAIMKQMFTVTKRKRRHTFVQTVLRASMVTEGSEPLQSTEIDNLMRRFWSPNATEQHAPLLENLISSVVAARDGNKSFSAGINAVSNANLTTTQVMWEYLTVETAGAVQYSALRMSLVNITLIRSETLVAEPAPFGPCDASFQNEAYGGKVTGSDCRQRFQGNGSRFYGQVDTSAVLILTGLGDGASNVSSAALNEAVWEWCLDKGDRMDNLLVARGFLVSIDPSFVTLRLETIEAALSHLQVMLVALAAFLAVAGWVLLKVFAGAHWSNSLLSNLIFTTLPPSSKKHPKPGYLIKTPDIQLRKTLAAPTAITVDGDAVRLERPLHAPSLQKQTPETAQLTPGESG